jgi:exonuclease VII small subunit
MNTMPITIIIIGFCIYIAFRLSQLRKIETEDDQKFWNREREANFTPKRDISNLSYITIPLNKFPSDYIDKEEEITKKELEELSEKRILNLDSMSNTDLKVSFGFANLNIMEEIGENYVKMCKYLIKLAEKRIEASDYEGAIKYLEFGVGTKSDMSQMYTLLGECYAKLGKNHKISDLIQLVQSMNLPLEKSIISSLTSHLSNLEMDIPNEEDTPRTLDV